jgi:hypothetical protein
MEFGKGKIIDLIFKLSNMKKLTFLLFLTLLLNSCGLLGDKVSPISIEALKTSKPAAIGSISTLALSGGSVAIASAGAKVSAAAGVLSTPLSIQASADPIDNEGQGITISGDWKKPITVEFAIPTGVTDPENYKIALRLDNGYWISCLKPKVNRSTNTVSVRIAATTTTSASSKARPFSTSYSLAFAKTFYMKPDKGIIKVGESIKFTPYALEGYIPRKLLSGETFTSEDEFNAALKKQNDLINELDGNEDDLVPINPPKDDEPLTVIVNDYPFTNNKDGFTRTWTAKSIGTVKADGNAGATYTAPKDDAAKGKTVKVIFSSTNDKTKRNATAEATVRIEDGLTRYTGTIKNEYVWQTGNLNIEREIVNIQFVGSFVNSVNFPNIFSADKESSKLIVTKYDYYLTPFNNRTETRTIIGVLENEKFGSSVSIVLNPTDKNYIFTGDMNTDLKVLYKNESNDPKFAESNFSQEQAKGFILFVNPNDEKKKFTTTDISTLTGQMTEVLPNLSLKSLTTTWSLQKK